MSKVAKSGELSSDTLRLTAAVVGYTLFIIGNSYTLREPSAFYPFAALFSEDAQRALTYFPFALASIALGVVAIRRSKALRLLDRYSVAAFAVGESLVLLTAAGILPPAASALAMIVLALYCAFMFTSWVSVSLSLSRGDLWLLLIISSVTSVVGGIAISALTSTVPGAFVFPILSLGSLALLALCRRLSGTEPFAPPFSEKGSMAPWRVLAEHLPVTLSVAALGFVASLSRSIFEVPVIEDALQAELAAVVVAGCILLILVFLAKVPINPNSVILGLTPVVCVTCFLVPISGAPLHLVFLGIATTCFTVGLLLLQVVAKNFSEDNLPCAVGCYNLTAGTVCFLSSVGYMMPLSKLSSFSGLPTYAIAAILCLMVLVLSLSVERVISERALARHGAPQRTTEEAVRILAKRYALTEREEEVLGLMANGRDIPTIAKMLFLSQNTVRTHSKHIFKKMDVHSRQNCLDLVQQEERRA